MASAPLDVVRLVGRGAFAAVYMVQAANNGFVAAKCLRNDALFERELAFLSACSHPNVVSALWSFSLAGTGGGGIIAMPLFRHDLRQSIRSRTGLVDPHQRLLVARDMAAGLAHLHDRSIVHCDVKPGNVLVCTHGKQTTRAVICDLGSAAFEDDPVLQTTRRTTLAYCAPEAVSDAAHAHKHNNVSRAIDVWGWGCVLYEMGAGRPLFASVSEAEHARALALGVEWERDDLSPLERTLLGWVFVECPGRVGASALLRKCDDARCVPARRRV